MSIRTGSYWSSEEDNKLDDEVKSHLILEKIAELHQRTVNAVKCRIIKHINEGRLEQSVNSEYNLSEKPTTIYVLELENGKFYVGRTDNFQERLLKHQQGQGCAWTNTHKYKDTLQVFQGDKFDEDKTVLKFMNKYGIENVRGGAYSNIELSFEQYIAIRRQINNANNLCLACGEHGHFISDCKTEICYRCGKNGHLASSCQENTNINNGKLDGCTRCGRPDHWAFRCNRSKDVFGRVLEPRGYECIIF